MNRTRRFALVLIAGGVALLGATMITNFTLDPQYVFGTRLTRDDENANYRYHRLLQYQAARERFDGLLFASSRGKAIDADLLAAKAGVRAVAKFDVTAAMMTDHLPALDYVLRDKAERGERIRIVLLLLDVDSFGKLPATNVNIDSFLPPELSGEHPLRFWWRYLTVFQFRMWRGIIAYRLKRADPSAVANTKTSALAVRRFVVAGAGVPAPWLRLHPVVSPASDTPRSKLLVATRPNLAAHLDMVARFAALCRDHGIALTVATTPMRGDAMTLYNRADLRDVVERLSRVVPVWDFSAPDWLAWNADYWDDSSHFKPVVGAMMLERMFAPSPAAPGDFGVLRNASRAVTSALQ